MKKAIMLMLGASLMFSMVACGGKETAEPAQSAAVESENNEEAPSESAAAEGEAAAQEATEEAATDAGNAEAADAAASADVEVPAEYKDWIPEGATNIMAQEAAGVQAYAFTPAGDAETTKQWFKDKVAEKGLSVQTDTELTEGVWSFVATTEDQTMIYSFSVAEAGGVLQGAVSITNMADAVAAAEDLVKQN